MKNLWIDLTTTRDWTRPAVGVVRVEQRVAQWFLRHRADLSRFCVYDHADNAFTEIPATEAARWLDPDVGVALARARRQVVAPDLETRLNIVGKRLVSSPSVRRALGRLKPGIDASIRLGRQARSEVARLMPQAPPRPIAGLPRAARTPFARGDVLFSMGLDWEKKDMAALYVAKHETGFRVAGVCHDVVPVLFPQYCLPHVAAPFARYVCDLAWTADLVLCVSLCSRSDFNRAAEMLGAVVPRTEVIRLGNDVARLSESPRDERLRAVIAEPFVLFVSTIERRKNHATLLHAYARLVERGIAVPKLVLVGMPGWGTEDVLDMLDRDPRLRGRVVSLHDVDDSDLAHLYERCAFTVYPSWYEGWGLPVAESLNRGKPCIASNAASIPEIAGDLVDYVDPLDGLGWMNALEKYMTDPEYVRQRVARIRAEYRAPSWDVSAEHVWQRLAELW